MEIKVKDLSGQEVPCAMITEDNVLTIMINTPVLFERHIKSKNDELALLKQVFTKEEIEKLKPHMSFFLDEYTKETFDGSKDLHKTYLKEKTETKDLNLLNKKYMNLILKLI